MIWSTICTKKAGKKCLILYLYLSSFGIMSWCPGIPARQSKELMNLWILMILIHFHHCRHRSFLMFSLSCLLPSSSSWPLCPFNSMYSSFWYLPYLPVGQDVPGSSPILPASDLDSTTSQRALIPFRGKQYSESTISLLWGCF